VVRAVRSARAARRRGFTLIEGLLAAGILAAASAALILPFAVGAQNQNITSEHAVAVNLAEALLEEILSKPFYDPNSATRLGPEAGEATRPQFDNIDDYNGYIESAGRLRDAQGARISDASLASYGRRVTVAYVYLPNQSHADPPTMVRVTVDVTRNGAAVYSLCRLIGRRNSQPLAGGVLQ